MILPDKDPKKLAAMILVKKGENGEPDESKHMERDSEDMDIGLVAAAEEIVNSIEKKDSQGLVVALKDFISMCGGYSEGE